MRSSIIIGAGVILLVLFYAAWTGGLLPSMSGHTIDLGGAVVDDATDLTPVSLVNSTNGGAQDGNYDSYDQPQGTTFRVATGTTLVITGVLIPAGAGASGSNAQIGYAPESVADSASAASSSVVVFDQRFELDGSSPQDLDTYLEIPEGQVPWARVEGAGTWSITVRGYSRP